MTCPSFAFDNPFEQEHCTKRGPRIMLFLKQMRTALYQEKIALDEKLFYVYFLVKNYFLSHYIVKFKMCGLQTAL